MYIAFVTVIILTSCESNTIDTDVDINNMELFKILNKKYGIAEINYNVDLNKTKLPLSKSNNDWDYSNARQYRFEESSKKIYIANSKTNYDKYSIIRTVNAKGVTIIDLELFCEINLDDNGNGYLYLLNSEGKQIESFELLNGIPQDIECIKNTKTAKKSIFCQREGNEGTSQCYKREVDEFCDGFIGCLALTNPQVHALILGLCTC